jgi:N utilization substance protein B
MGKRREGRQLVVQFLYQHEHAPAFSLEEELDAFWRIVECSPEARAFATPLIRAILPRLPELDALINRCAQNWKTDRIAPVDKNILRLALYEMHYVPEVPPVVAINEAIEIAKTMSTQESGKFVNGILDRARKDLNRPAREPAPRPTKPSAS